MTEPLNILILDDEQLCIDQLKQMLHAFDYVRVVGELNSGDGYMEALKTLPVDLVFLDIRIQEESGFSIAEFTKRNFPEKMIIFTTGFEDFAMQGYEYEPLDFLAKPVNFLRLEKALSHAREKKSRMTPLSHPRIGIHVSGGFRFIDVSTILFVERVGRKLVMACWETDHVETYQLRESMTELEKIFDGYGFLRVHQSYLVSALHISQISGTEAGGGYDLKVEHWDASIPVSRLKYREIQHRLQERGIRFL